jgi:hypothetical protein
MYIFPDPGFPLNLIFIIFVVILLVSDFRSSGKYGHRKHKKTKTPIVVPKLSDSQRKMLQYIIDEHEGYTVEVYFIGCNHDFEYADTTVGCFAGFYKAPGVPHTGPNIIEWAEKNTSW